MAKSKPAATPQAGAKQNTKKRSAPAASDKATPPIKRSVAKTTSTTPTQLAAKSASKALPADTSQTPLDGWIDASDSAPDHIRVRGARTHNLRNLDVDLPRDRLVVITGRSGSGKSSLAFDTIYAEGQRQYIETLSVYARQFLGQMQRPDAELIDGLQPTICIDQKPGAASPRSTVGTVTEIYDYLRLLMSKAGTIHCRGCGKAIQQQTYEEISRHILRLPEKTRLVILSPMVRGRKGAHAEVLEKIRKAGMVRVEVDGQLHDIDAVPKLAVRQEHDISAIVDRIVLRDGVEGRLNESLKLALRLGDGMVLVQHQVLEDAVGPASATSPAPAGGKAKTQSPSDQTQSPSDQAVPVWETTLYSTHSACLDCGISYGEILPRTFSFNSPYGACPACGGLGSLEHFMPTAVIPNRDRSLKQGAVTAWKDLKGKTLQKRWADLSGLLKTVGLQLDQPLSELDDTRWHTFLFHSDKRQPGLLLLLEKELSTTSNEQHLETLQSLRGQVPCNACRGSRLNDEARQVRLLGKTIDQILDWDIDTAVAFFRELESSQQLTGITREVAIGPVREIVRRLTFLQEVAVNYLTLGRGAATLSGGEFQRVRLATAIGMGLTHVCFVLDEPSIGLHQRDNQLLISVLKKLQAEGNSVIVVEHDEEVMRAADWIIDMGPGAGEHGGTIVSQGTIDTILHDQDSLTAAYLNGTRKIQRRSPLRTSEPSGWITLKGARFHNLQNLEVAFPLGRLICVTGVSGSGKSSLIHDTLGAALQRKLGSPSVVPGPYDELTGTAAIEQVIRVDQASIGRSSRSNTATYTGVFDEIRKVFTATKLAKQLGFSIARFSFNSVHGRCPQCEGHGRERIEMKFLPDLFVLCPLCRGARFNTQTLRVKFRDKTIADVLEMSCAQARDFFDQIQRIHRVLDALCQVGLDYLPLGQASTTLSGGEAQRIKLATQLAKPEAGKAFYILDEPSTGLHFEDIQKLLDVLDLLVEKGNTVLVVEHNLDLIRNADWIIDIGPDGGRGGGQLLAAGPPASVAKIKNSYTGQFLADLL